MQRAEFLARTEASLGVDGALAGLVETLVDEGVQARVAFLDPADEVLDGLHRGQLPLRMASAIVAAEA